MNPIYEKKSILGKPIGTTNANPFHSNIAESRSPHQIFNKNNPLQPQNKYSYSPPVKSPFAQPHTHLNGTITHSQANASIMLANSKTANPQGNPFAHINSQTNPGLLPASIPKTSTVPFKPQDPIISASTHSFFNKPGMGSQMNSVFNKNGTNQQTTSPILFTNTLNGVTSNTSTNKPFTTSNNIFTQNQSSTGNLQNTIFNNSSLTQQAATYGQTQNSFAYNTQQPTNNIFHNNTQNKPASIFSNYQAQYNIAQQQEPTQFNQQTQMQTNIDVNRAISQYFQLYKQNLTQKQPFQQSTSTHPQTSQTNYQFNTQQQNADYYLFLNSLVNNQTLIKNATPREIFDFTEDWVIRMSQQRHQQSLTAKQQEAKKEITKLFDLKVDPTLYEMRMKELPPIQFTMQLLQKMNDPFSCKMIVSQLWLRLKERFCVIMNSVRSVVPDSGSIKIKELPYYNQMLVMRKELLSMVQKVRELKQKDKDIKRDKHDHGRIIEAALSQYKNAVSEVNLNNKILESANEDLEKMLDYIEKNLRTLFKAYIEKEPISFQDPDQFMLEISQRMSSEMHALSRMVDDHLAIESNTDQTIDFLELAGNVCNFYEQIATKLYAVREKMKRMIQIVAQYRSYGSYQDLQKKIEEKAKTVLDQKMEVYNCIREIDEILEGKFQVEKQGKKEGRSGSSLLEKKLSQTKTKSD